MADAAVLSGGVELALNATAVFIVSIAAYATAPDQFSLLASSVRGRFRRVAQFFGMPVTLNVPAADHAHMTDTVRPEVWPGTPDEQIAALRQRVIELEQSADNTKARLDSMDQQVPRRIAAAVDELRHELAQANLIATRNQVLGAALVIATTMLAAFILPLAKLSLPGAWVALGVAGAAVVGAAVVARRARA